MPAHIITIAQQKGGSGKTTLAVQLATTWAKQGRAVAIVDIDPQGSASTWHAIRAEMPANAQLPTIALRQITGWRLSTELSKLKQQFDIILIDSPPHAETEAKTAIREADVVILPMQPSPMDLWALSPTLAITKKEQTPALIVFNRTPARGKLADTVSEKLHTQGATVAQSRLGNRVAFAASMMDGRGVAEQAGSPRAVQEIAALAHEIYDYMQT
jgi:chromosome partitioning protein